MLFTALAYSWYQDKNRNTPPELYDKSSGSQDQWTVSQYWTFIFVFICEVILLMYAIPLAMRVARTTQELFGHLILAVIFTPLYVGGAVLIQMYGYYSGAR